MPEPETPKNMQPLCSLEFVFEMGLKKLEHQERLIDSLDVKMGVLIGFLGAFIVGLLAAAFTSDARKLLPSLWCPTKVVLAAGLLLIGISLYFAFQAFRTREYSLGLNVAELSQWSNEAEPETKNAFLPTILKAIEGSKGQLTLKGDSTRRAIWFVFAGLMALLIALLLSGAQILLGRGTL